jgi:hypothetical protein
MKTGDTMSAPAGNDLEVARLLAYGQRGAGPVGVTQPWGTAQPATITTRPSIPETLPPPTVRFEASAVDACGAIPGPFSRLGDGKW